MRSVYYLYMLVYPSYLLRWLHLKSFGGTYVVHHSRFCVVLWVIYLSFFFVSIFNFYLCLFVCLLALYLRDMQVISDLLGNILLIIVITNVSVSMLFPFVNNDLSVYILVCLFVYSFVSLSYILNAQCCLCLWIDHPALSVQFSQMFN
jgi:hypothetical protein